MIRSLTMVLGTCAAAGLLVLSFVVWSRSGRLTGDYPRPEVAAAGVRCLAAAVFAAAQLLILLVIVDKVYRRSSIGWLIRAGVGVGGSIALACGIALSWVAR